MPKLVSLYIRHTLIGFLVAAVFVALLFWFNVAGLWHLVTHDPAGPLAAFLLFMFNGIVFSGVQFGIAITRLSEKDSAPPKGGRPVPVRVAAEAPKRAL